MAQDSFIPHCQIRKLRCWGQSHCIGRCWKARFRDFRKTLNTLTQVGNWEPRFVCGGNHGQDWISQLLHSWSGRERNGEQLSNSYKWTLHTWNIDDRPPTFIFVCILSVYCQDAIYFVREGCKGHLCRRRYQPLPYFLSALCIPLLATGSEIIRSIPVNQTHQWSWIQNLKDGDATTFKVKGILHQKSLFQTTQ